MESCTGLPIIYNKRYNISFLGLEKLHPFDTEKYKKIFAYLNKKFDLPKDCVFRPTAVSDQDLLLVHSRAYLDSLRNAAVVAQIGEISLLARLPRFILQSRLLDPLKLAAGGTVLGTDLALKYGWAVNLGGGFHHAKRDEGGGFCFFADIPLAVIKVLEKHPDYKILIVDLDAHQGNGVADLLKDEPRAYIFDIFNKHAYPYDEESQKHIDFKYPISPDIDDASYLALLKQQLPEVIDRVKPDLIIYNAGTDLLRGDKLGYMDISADAIVARDCFVFEQAHKKEIPILMVLSGGYTKKSAGVVGKSIEQIMYDRGLL